jgi:hypothetical protein
MSRVSLKMSALGMALALPALAGAQSDHHQQQPAAQNCGWEEPQSGSDDPRWQWRLRAYRHLDCVTTIVDQALSATPAGTAGKDTVTISRQELERIRTLAWWARDAAARIGQ